MGDCMKSGILTAGMFAFCAAFFLAPVTAQPVDDGSLAGIIGKRGNPRAPARRNIMAWPTMTCAGRFRPFPGLASRSFGGVGLLPGAPRKRRSIKTSRRRWC